MTAVHHYTVRCDHEDCASTFTALVPTAAETRRLASARGWSQRVVRKSPTRHAADDICPMHGERLASFRPPSEVPECPCLCDARGQGQCLAHLDDLSWSRILASAARSLCTTVSGVDMEQLVMSGLALCTRAHARVALEALGYRPSERG